MAFPLHKSPRGLLEVFRLRTLGAQPPNFGDVVQPSVDVTEFYGSDLTTALAQAGTVGALAPQLVNNMQVTVPRRVLGLGATLIIGAAAATNITLTIGVSAGAAGVFVPLTSIFIAAAPAAAVIHHGVIVPGFVIAPQAAFTAAVHGTAAGADHALNVNALFQDLNPSSGL